VSGNPEATIQKAKQIRAAALAPADPSTQDRAVAASASAMESQAQQELQKEEQEASASSDEDVPGTFSRIDLFA
jgi:ribosomal protein L12E/L44/L45/RPP1/RPP2